MGCSPSRVNPQGNEATTPRPMPTDRKANGHVKNGQVRKTDSNANQKDINTNNPGQWPCVLLIDLICTCKGTVYKM